MSQIDRESHRGSLTDAVRLWDSVMCTCPKLAAATGAGVMTDMMALAG